MTCREKLKLECPENIRQGAFGGCCGCPSDYGYMDKPDWCWKTNIPQEHRCTRCWDREIPGTESAKKAVYDVGSCLASGFAAGIRDNRQDNALALAVAKHVANSVYGVRNVDKFEIANVIFNDPATIVVWKDGTKTVVKCQEGDTFDAWKGLATAIAKRALGDKSNYNEIFKKWISDKT